MLFFLLFSLAAGAAEKKVDCEAGGIVDYREHKCLPPVRHQTDSGWCYAFSAADALSFETCENISAPALALGYIERAFKSTKLLEGGRPETAAIIGVMEGLCLDRDMPSNIFHQGEAIGIIEAYRRFKKRDQTSGESRGVVDPKEAFPRLSKVDVLRAYWDKHFDEPAFALRRIACKKRLSPNLQVRSCEGGAEAKLAFIEKWIKEKPVMMGGDSEASSSEQDQSLIPWRGSHSTLVVARVWNRATSQCGFWIRDPAWWGKEPYHFISRERLKEVLNKNPSFDCFALEKGGNYGDLGAQLRALIERWQKIRKRER